MFFKKEYLRMEREMHDAENIVREYIVREYIALAYPQKAAYSLGNWSKPSLTLKQIIAEKLAAITEQKRKDQLERDVREAIFKIKREERLNPPGRNRQYFFYPDSLVKAETFVVTDSKGAVSTTATPTPSSRDKFSNLVSKFGGDRVTISKKRVLEIFDEVTK